MRHRINVTFDEEDFKIIKNIADKNHITFSEVVRNFTQQGINGEVGANNIDLIARILREQVKATTESEFDHLASLIAKTCIMASTGAYLNAEVIDRFVPENKRIDLKSAYDAAHIKAVQYTKARIYSDND